MNAKLHGYEVDAQWREHGLAVELDSWRHHGTRAAFERDKERDAELHAHGITTLRFTYRQVTQRPGWVGKPAQPCTRPTFSAWIFLIAPFRRVSGNGASAPRSTSADR